MRCIPGAEGVNCLSSAKTVSLDLAPALPGGGLLLRAVYWPCSHPAGAARGVARWHNRPMLPATRDLDDADRGRPSRAAEADDRCRSLPHVAAREAAGGGPRQV